MPPTLNSIEKSQQNHHLQHKIRLARTISREPEVKESSVDDDDEDDDGQVSAVWFPVTGNYLLTTIFGPLVTWYVTFFFNTKNMVKFSAV